MNTDARVRGCELLFSGTLDEAFPWPRYRDRVRGSSPRLEASTIKRLQSRSTQALAHAAASSALAAPSDAERRHGHG